MEKLEELIYTGFKETDRKSQDPHRELQEMQREIRNLNRQVENITDKLGIFAENMVAPAMVKLFSEKGFPITDYSQRLRSSRRRVEYDIAAFSKDYILVVSVKMTLEVDDVKHFLKERLPIFKELFPRYSDMKVIGAVAGTDIVGESDTYAMKRGLYALAQSGENVVLLNNDTFKAKIF